METTYCINLYLLKSFVIFLFNTLKNTLETVFYTTLDTTHLFSHPTSQIICASCQHMQGLA